MQLNDFYEKVRLAEVSISSDFVVIVSRRKGDGSVDGVLTEVSRRNAALRIAGGAADLATPEQTSEYYEKLAADREKAEQDAARRMMTFTVVPAFQPPAPKPARKRKGD